MSVGFPEDHFLSVGSPIHVEHANGLREFLQGKIGKGKKSKVNEISSGAGIDKGSGFDGLCSNK